MNQASDPDPMVTEDPVVRLADPTDHPAVIDMDRIGRSAILEHKGGLAWAAEHPPVGELIPQETFSFLVADIAGHAVGFLVHIDRHDSSRGRICVIERVYVDERAREIGCGDALLAQAVRQARERGCTFVEGEALPGDRETKNLYERAGITARRIVVSKSLSNPSTGAPASR